MNIDLSNLGTVGPVVALAIVVLQALILLRKLIQYWQGKKQPGQPASKGSAAAEFPRFFSGFVLTAATALAVILLLVLSSSPQIPALMRILILIAGAVAALVIFSALLLVLGAPAFNAFMELRQGFEKLEKRLEVVETQSREQSVFIEQQFPAQREFSFDEKRYGASAEDKYEAN